MLNKTDDVVGIQAANTPKVIEEKQEFKGDFNTDNIQALTQVGGLFSAILQVWPRLRWCPCILPADQPAVFSDLQ